MDDPRPAHLAVSERLVPKPLADYPLAEFVYSSAVLRERDADSHLKSNKFNGDGLRLDWSGCKDGASLLVS